MQFDSESLHEEIEHYSDTEIAICTVNKFTWTRLKTIELSENQQLSALFRPNPKSFSIVEV